MLEIIILTPVFVMLFVISFNALKSTLNYSRTMCLILAACVSALAVIAVAHFLQGSFQVILLPYAALGISVLLLLVILLIRRSLARPREGRSRRSNDEPVRNQ